MKVSPNQAIIKQKLNMEEIPKPYRDVAKGMEQQFIQFMIERMKASTNSANPDSSAMNFYKGIQTSEQAEIMANQDGGLGLQEVILDQIYPQHLRRKNPMAINAYKNQQAQVLRGEQRE